MDIDTLAKSIGRRGLVTGVIAALIPGSLVAKNKVRREVPKCRIAGHPCEGNQDCCAGLECRVTQPGNAERCAVPGGDDPPPVDPPTNDDPGDGPGGGPDGGSRRRKRSGDAKSKRKKGKQKREHCHHDSECAEGWKCLGGRKDTGRHRSCRKV
jgi:hypothetical protein